MFKLLPTPKKTINSTLYTHWYTKEKISLTLTMLQAGEKEAPMEHTLSWGVNGCRTLRPCPAKGDNFKQFKTSCLPKTPFGVLPHSISFTPTKTRQPLPTPVCCHWAQMSSHAGDPPPPSKPGAGNILTFLSFLL